MLQSKDTLKEPEDEERERKTKLYELYLKLGNVNLLAQDYARGFNKFFKFILFVIQNFKSAMFWSYGYKNLDKKFFPGIWPFQTKCCQMIWLIHVEI